MAEVSRGFPPGDLRVSDADRDRAISELGEALRAGRITADEFDQRSGQAVRARTGNELTALLADLPISTADLPMETADLPISTADLTPDYGQATGGTALESPGHALAARGVMAACAVTAAVLSAVAVTNALTFGPSLQQREFLQQFAARQGITIPLPPASGFNWAGTITPLAVAALLVMLIAFLHVARTGRR